MILHDSKQSKSAASSFAYLNALRFSQFKCIDVTIHAATEANCRKVKAILSNHRTRKHMEHHGTMEALNRSGFQLLPHAACMYDLHCSPIFRQVFKFSNSGHLISVSSSFKALALLDKVLSVGHSQCMNWPTMRSCKMGRREGIRTAVKDYIDTNIVVLIMDRC